MFRINFENKIKFVDDDDDDDDENNNNNKSKILPVDILLAFGLDLIFFFY